MFSIRSERFASIEIRVGCTQWKNQARNCSTLILPAQRRLTALSCKRRVAQAAALAQGAGLPVDQVAQLSLQQRSDSLPMTRRRQEGLQRC